AGPAPGALHGEAVNTTRPHSGPESNAGSPGLERHSEAAAQTQSRPSRPVGAAAFEPVQFEQAIEEPFESSTRPALRRPGLLDSSGLEGEKPAQPGGGSSGSGAGSSSPQGGGSGGGGTSGASAAPAALGDPGLALPNPGLPSPKGLSSPVASPSQARG